MWFLVLGWNKDGSAAGAPLGLADWFGVRHGALTFHYGIGATAFKTRRAAQRAITRTVNLNRYYWERFHILRVTAHNA